MDDDISQQTKAIAAAAVFAIKVSSERDHTITQTATKEEDAINMMFFQNRRHQHDSTTISSRVARWSTLLLTAIVIRSTNTNFSVVTACDDCDNDENECWLCGNVGQAPNDWYAILPDGQSCTQYYLYMYDNLRDGSDDCYNAQDYVSNCCCNENGKVPDSCQPGGSNAQANYDTVEENTGPYAQCFICDYTPYLYPGNPTNAMSVRYLGDYSCSELYYMGLKGDIPDYLCGPLQYDQTTQSTCGCSTKNGAELHKPSGRNGSGGGNGFMNTFTNVFNKGNGGGGTSTNSNGSTATNANGSFFHYSGRMTFTELLSALLILFAVGIWIMAIKKEKQKKKSGGNNNKKKMSKNTTTTTTLEPDVYHTMT